MVVWLLGWLLGVGVGVVGGGVLLITFDYVVICGYAVRLLFGCCWYIFGRCKMLLNSL